MKQDSSKIPFFHKMSTGIQIRKMVVDMIDGMLIAKFLGKKHEDISHDFSISKFENIYFLLTKRRITT